MYHARTVLPEHLLMAGRGVTLMGLKTVLRENTVILRENAVPDHFGDDRSAGDTHHLPVAFNDRFAFKRQAAFKTVSVNQAADFLREPG